MQRRYEHDRAAFFPTPTLLSITRKDGSARVIEFSAYRHGDEDVWLLFDVTGRNAAEEKFRILFEHSSDAHLICDDTGIIDCNNAAARMLGCNDKRQVLSLHPAVLSPTNQPDGRSSMGKSVEMVAIARRQGSHRFEWIHRRVDGTDFPVEVTLTPVTLSSQPAMLMEWHDIHDRKRVESQLVASKRAVRAGYSRFQ